MFDKTYLYLKKEESIDLAIIVATLTFLFTFSNYLFSKSFIGFVNTYFVFFIFIGFVLLSRLIIMKLVGYYNAFEIILRQTYFDRFWINKWDRLTYLENKGEKTIHKKSNFKGLPMSFISFIIYVLSLGFIIYPGIWNYTIKKIPHLFLGTRQKFENKMGHMHNIDISDYRYSKALFLGFLYYFVIGLLVKIFLSNASMYFWFEFITFWLCFASLIPIFGNEGYELFRRNNFAWISVFTILILGFLSLLIFQSIGFVLTATIIASLIIIFYLFWRKLL